MLDSSDWCVASFVCSDRLRSVVRARLSVTDEERSFRSVVVWVIVQDVNLFLCVKHVLETRAVKEFISHGDGGRKGRCADKKQTNTKAGGVRLSLTKAMGRLCMLVCAQLVCAQHADAALGASESVRLCQRSLGCAVHCHPI
ncbi:hypothetical protein POSPLADRAFT_1151910 [Postia placenta MAD-698-R-SB12]|uniref:Uncharacterized protein n=1 Tax=Postia placenta MAD-698-R-SB12 TaxID=670580 RepID=A0A1X6MR70_9APHY|nr:hypothetical protein POSPLADRAFT_1151910 [Postia placenta MAD-698-R-SB12]OSX58868.1 hypothetical protein POSPLADRAFT_1151910 [Postia placenta MAD-698-R-SB12]